MLVPLTVGSLGIRISSFEFIGVLTSGTERRIGLDEDTLVVTVLFQFVFWVVWVVFNLVDGRDNLPGLGKVLKDRDTGVGNTDSLCLALGEDSLHLLPGLGLVPVPIDVSRAVLFDGEELVSSVLDRSAGQSEKSLALYGQTRLTWASERGRGRGSRFRGI